MLVRFLRYREYSATWDCLSPSHYVNTLILSYIRNVWQIFARTESADTNKSCMYVSLCIDSLMSLINYQYTVS